MLYGQVVQLGDPAAILILRGYIDQLILPVWTLGEATDAALPVDTDHVTVYDIMGRPSAPAKSGNQLSIHLTHAVQYVTFPANAWVESIAKTELEKQLPECGVSSSGALPDALEKEALKVGAGLPPTMSVPIRSQSGSMPPSRVQLCRSGMNTVLGGTRGLVADNQRKLPSVPVSSTCGTKK